MIDLSIIIVSWNTKEYLLHCLKSIFEAGESKGWEVIVVDNGSKDDSGRELKRFFPSVHLIQNEKNQGFAKAVNQGARKASGKYILLLNPDTQVKHGAMERLISFMENHPDVGIAGAQLLNSDGSKQNSIANFPSLATELLNKNFLKWLFPETFPGKERDYDEPIEVDSVIGACMMVRLDAIQQVGPLDENYFLFLEETDWCYRMKRAGWKVYHVPQAEVYHFQGKSAEKDKKRGRVEYFRSRSYFFKKNRGGGQRFFLLTGSLIKLGCELLAMAVASLITLFTVKSWQKKLIIYAYLFWWHLRLCPDGMGLRPITLPSPQRGQGRDDG